MDKCLWRVCVCVCVCVCVKVCVCGDVEYTIKRRTKGGRVKDGEQEESKSERERDGEGVAEGKREKLTASFFIFLPNVISSLTASTFIFNDSLNDIPTQCNIIHTLLKSLSHVVHQKPQITTVAMATLPQHCLITHGLFIAQYRQGDLNTCTCTHVKGINGKILWHLD